MRSSEDAPRGIDIADRPEAIDWVLAEARPGDSVLITGRADEDFLIDDQGRVPYPTDAELITASLHRNPQPIAADDH